MAIPLTGPEGVLAHTFYPAPPNPESIAGDMHFDDDETWRIGVNTDLFSAGVARSGTRPWTRALRQPQRRDVSVL
jgi:hypothetical protein